MDRLAIRRDFQDMDEAKKNGEAAAAAEAADEDKKKDDAEQEVKAEEVKTEEKKVEEAAPADDGRINFEFCDRYVKEFEEVVKNPRRTGSKVYYTGIDLGTACVVMVVLDEDHKPVAGAYQYADVVRDGMIVNYAGAVKIVRDMKERIEEALGAELIYAAGAIPPGTDAVDGGAVKNVIQSAGFEVTSMLDEPSAANLLLNLQNGAVVDIGGGTTGISILRDGKVVSISDEATGGTHFTLVISGSYKKPFEEADLFKRDSRNHQELLPVLKPVIEKIATIIQRGTAGHDIETIVLVGGSSCLTGIEGIIEKTTGIHTYKPLNPLFVTPIGIAMSCTDKIMY